MPPGSSQKGTGKKGAGAMARQRSRNTTPSSVPPTASLPPVETIQTEYLDLPFEIFRNLTYEDLVDQTASSAVIPDSKSLDGIITRLTRLQETIEKRGVHCDRGMRLLAGNRRARMDELAAERSREEERLRREAADDEERERKANKANKANKKKRKATESLVLQEINTERSPPLRDPPSKARNRDNDSASSSLSPPAPATPSAMDVDKPKAEEHDGDSDSSSDDGAPPPPRIPQANTFGEDPSTFPDPTVYEIRPVKPGMTEEEIREIYSVATYPRSDLGDLIAGDPPDKDFSNAKPSNQISFSTFSTYIEPYFRPFTEEDLAFLRERGDRVTPFQMPKRGKKHYTEIWAEEDGAMAIDSSPGRDKLPPNVPRGSIEHMDDDVAETDKLSVGPLLSRLLQAMRPESRAPPPAEDGRPLTNGANGGDTPMNGSSADLSMNGIDSFDAAAPPSNPTPGEPSVPPAAFMPESSTEAWKKASHPKLDYMQVDERIKQELRHIGFLPVVEPGQEVPPEAKPDYDGHYDDEVAARLRLLQARLREQMLVNGARKARLTDLVKERMAHQEYQTILEDLDGQVNSAYLKRTRTLGKTKKKARPGASAASHAAGGSGAAAAAAGMARPGIGDVTRTLMERRRRWIENIGTVFDDPGLGKVPRSGDPDSSIFKPGEMAGLVKREKDAWDDEVDEE